ncbi:ABC transporter substrate-binding protein [Trueperella pecoris]|uniref:Sugar ABC transporter substrate-binding protein n=1 Tax=Trueperella pecoris TaxID=2733571 RepID=A0A7M1QWG2_9ACTO|nr:sugar ABC transporter substrate-binding protein [Trueperella pecoris]QOR45487.1 sugar ABC transporter substrate-binding protein [Trueperella pecoris]
MKRSFKTFAAAVATLALLAGCGGSGTTESKDTATKLNMWVPPLAANNQDKELWDEIVAPFEKDNNVDVNITVIPWDAYETKYLTGISSNDGPDVGYMYSEMIGDYIAKGQLVDLTDKVTKEQKDNFYFLKNGEFDGKQYSIPLIVGGARVLFYNKDLLAKAGVEAPTTWQEFLDAGVKLKEAGIKPYTAAWGDPARGAMNHVFFPYLFQAGGKLFADDGSRTLFDSPEMMEAAKFVTELRDKGVLDETATGTTPETQRKDFEEGKAAFVITSDQDMQKWTDAGINWGAITSLKGKQEGTFIASDSLAMLKKCGDQDLCYKLISFVTSGPQMEKLHKQAAFPPLGKDEKSTYPEQFAKMYAEQANILHPLPVIPNGTGTYQVLYENLQQMLNGQKTPEQALGDAATEANAMLAK